ncbi:MAG: hypothetical protein NTX25_17435, partial [Proteobacteria bacterium]|nr:hypothetical protein [Pseudomonadota bacterium]
IERIQARGVGLVVIEANIFYRQEIRARERLRIRTQFFHHDKKIWKAKQSMERSNGEICSRLELKACVFDLQKRCILAADPEWQAVFRGEFAVQNP